MNILFLRRKSFRHFCTLFTLTGIIFGSACIPKAEATIPIVRVDSEFEALIHAAELEYTNFVKETLTNLDDVKAILELSDTAFKLKDMVEDFDTQDLLDDLIDDAIDGVASTFDTKTLSTLLNGGLNGGDISQEAEKVIKEGSENVATSLQTGETGIAAANAIDTVKEGLEIAAGLPRTNVSKEEAEKQKSEAKPIEEQSDSEQSETAVKDATILVKEAAAMSMAGAQPTAAQMSTGTSQAIQQEYALELADKSRAGAMKEIIKLLAPYATDKESKVSYRYPINKIREQSQAAMERAAEHSKGGPSQALKTIAGLSAVLVEQQNLQNELLITLADILADDIKMTGLNAVLSVENYASGIQKNIEQYQRIYERVSVIR